MQQHRQSSGVLEKSLPKEKKASGGAAGKLGKPVRSSVSSLPVLFDLSDFKSQFVFDEFFNQLVQDVWGAQDTTPSKSASIQSRKESNGPAPLQSEGPTKLIAGVAIPEAEPMLRILNDAKGEVVGLTSKVTGRLDRLKNEVASHEVKCQDQFLQVKKALEGLFECFTRLDKRVTGVAQTAARISDQLQHTDQQKDCAYETVHLMKYMAEFNSSLPKNEEGSGEATDADSADHANRDAVKLSGLSLIFSDDKRVAEAAVIVQKLRSFAEGNIRGTPGGGADKTASTRLDVAVARLQDYCNDLENRLLAKFDMACQERDLKSMAGCAKILGEFNRGTSAMQRYVATLPMFIDVEVMNRDVRTLLGEEFQDGVPSLGPDKVGQGLAILYKGITDTVRKESAVIAVVFPSPAAVMAILVQRVLEQRVRLVLDKVLVKPSLSVPVPMEQGGYLQYLQILSICYDRTLGLAKDLQTFCRDQLECEGVAESLFSEHRDNYPEFERASLKQLFEAKMEELRQASLMPAQGGLVAPRGSRVSFASQMPVAVVSEFRKWNEDAISRCILFTTKPASLGAHVRAMFSIFLEQVSKHVVESLKKAQAVIDDATLLRERFAIGSGSSRRVAAAAATAAEAAAVAGESSYRAFMINAQRATAIVALVQQHFSNTVVRHIQHIDGFRAGCFDEMATALSTAEALILKGLHSCVDTIMGEVERLLAIEQKPTDFKPDEGDQPPEQGATIACTRVIAYLTRILETASAALEGPNKQAFFNEVGYRLQKELIAHLQRCIFSPSGAFRVKRDLSEYKNFVSTLQSPSVIEKFDLLGEMVNVLIVPPESLAALLDSSLKDVRKDALKFIELREDYKTSKIAKKLATEHAKSSN